MSPIYEGVVTYRSFAERVKARVRERAREAFDVLPSIYYYEGHSIGEVPLPPEAFASRQTKDRLSHVAIPRLIRLMEPRYFAVQYEMWQVHFEVKTPEQRREVEEAYERMVYPESIGPPSEHPDRYEVIHVHVMDAERLESYSAVKRPAGGLEPWEDLGVDAIAGLMIDPIKEALR